MNYFLVNYFLVQTDRQTESDAYEPTVQVAQVGSKVAQVGSKIHTFLFIRFLHESETWKWNAIAFPMQFAVLDRKWEM